MKNVRLLGCLFFFFSVYCHHYFYSVTPPLSLSRFLSYFVTDWYGYFYLFIVCGGETPSNKGVEDATSLHLGRYFFLHEPRIRPSNYTNIYNFIVKQFLCIILFLEQWVSEFWIKFFGSYLIMTSTQIEFIKKQKTSFCKNLFFFYYYCRIITEVSMRHEDKTKIKKIV